MAIIFGHSAASPYHLSVGAVLFNDDHEVACHHFDSVTDDKTKVTYRDFYILMRETLEPGESLEAAVARGLKEEFGASGKILDYLGPQLVSYSRGSYIFYKTTLYFLVSLDAIDTNERLDDDPERGSQVEWHEIDFLIEKMRSQTGSKFRSDMNEAEILERAKTQLQRLKLN